MDWIAQNWMWVLCAVGMIAMHMFGHGGHGGQGDTGATAMAPNRQANKLHDLLLDRTQVAPINPSIVD